MDRAKRMVAILILKSLVEVFVKYFTNSVLNENINEDLDD